MRGLQYSLRSVKSLAAANELDEAVGNLVRGGAMGAQGCVVAPSQHEFLDLIGKLEGMGYVCRGIRGEFYMTDSAKRELTYAFSLHKPRLLCQPRLNHFKTFGYTDSTPFELLKYLVDDAGWTWRPGLALKRGVHMIVGDRSPANCILYGGQSLATLRVFALAAREPETFTKKNDTNRALPQGHQVRSLV